MMHSLPEKPLHQLLAEMLPEFGVSHLFGVVGDANLFLVRHYRSEQLGRYIACTHEANAVLAALGFAQASGRTGVATITHGPALTNAVTALAEGAKGGIPLVVLCGDTAPGDTQHLQKIDQKPIIEATGATLVEMRSPETAIADLERAFAIATHRHTTVVFNMRVDLQWSNAARHTSLKPCIPAVRMAAAAPAEIEDAVGMLASARHPLILAGRGATDPQARDAIVRLAHRVEAPLATTLKAQGLFEGEAFDIGLCGGLSHPTAIDVIMRSDCIVAFGASLSKHTTEEGAYTQGKRVIQVLPDAEDNPRLDRPTLRLIGDLAETADAMTGLLDAAEIPGSQATSPDLAEHLAGEAASFDRLPEPRETAPGTLDIDHALRRLHQALPVERVLAADLGRFVTTAWRNLPVKRPQDLVYSCHFGAIGCGLGEALGAAVATTDRPTVLAVGDGGFQLSGLSELSTVIREKLDLIILLCNDGSYGAEHVQLTRRGMSTDISMIDTADFAATASAMGMDAVRVSDTASLETACDAIARRNGPLLIDIRLDPEKIEP
ncbi:thiamine pyrophosphate-binding protein [uncultured Martelella sp.]|uniref:thiamine pyrophosphate-binding protein n=1 Tax=uncultured Martelella sp. TaxID=392331 RepID=UPI0029C63734|nr:thiamine pyrophosphate-binding protein [uncultured Martelella sp.]